MNCGLKGRLGVVAGEGQSLMHRSEGRRLGFHRVYHSRVTVELVGERHNATSARE
jgi:hypothetical protein